MDIGVIGAGSMGGALGRLWVAAGHRVLFSYSRDPAKPEAIARAAGPNARAGSPRAAAAFGDVVVLTVPWATLADALGAAGPLAGKVLISSVMPLSPDRTALEVGHGTSAAEEVARLAPGARVVETFNSVFAPLLSREPRDFGGRRASVFFCGDDAAAKEAAAGLIRDAGLDPVDAGPLVNARYVEPFGMLMVQLAYAGGRGPEIAVGLLDRSPAAAPS